MSQKNLHLETLIDGDDLRNQLTALTQDSGMDGSSSKIRMQVLSILKEASKAGRERARQILFK
ncbi:MAG: hypothetical protein AAF412_05755, partial [Pseudomonadota bacterium]